MEQLLFFEENRLSVAVRGAQVTHLLYAAEQPVAQQLAGVADDTTLLQTSASGSVLCELRKGKMTTFSYAAYGDSSPSAQGMLGYNGAMRDAATGWYLMGQNYRRPLDVGLGRWLLPDSLSFFDGGPLNPYVYCDANPVVFRDPTGHAAEGWVAVACGVPTKTTPCVYRGNSAGGNSLDAWLSIGISAVFLVLGVISFGSALPAAFATGATVAAIISAVSLGAATIIETVALGLVIGGYVTESDGLMKQGSLRHMAALRLARRLRLFRLTRRCVGLPSGLRVGVNRRLRLGSVTSIGSTGSARAGVTTTNNLADNMPTEAFNLNFTMQARPEQSAPITSLSSPQPQPPVPNPKPSHSWGNFVNRNMRFPSGTFSTSYVAPHIIDFGSINWSHNINCEQPRS